MTPTSYIVLGLLERLGEASPYDLKGEATDTLGNFWSTPHSQMYRTVQQLAAAGLATARTERTPGGRARTLYALSPAGREALADWRREPPEDMPELRDPGLLKLHFGADPGRLARTRVRAHRRQLELYREAESHDPGDGPRGPWLTLRAGIGHEVEWVAFWERIVAEHPGPDEPPGDD